MVFANIVYDSIMGTLFCQTKTLMINIRALFWAWQTRLNFQMLNYGHYSFGRQGSIFKHDIKSTFTTEYTAYDLIS
jgi:hypothetical protein